MARQLLQHCLACNGWTLAAECCGQPTKAAAPIKWSPEDAKAPYRRRLENIEDPVWVDTLPARRAQRRGMKRRCADPDTPIIMPCRGDFLRYVAEGCMARRNQSRWHPCFVASPVWVTSAS